MQWDFATGAIQCTLKYCSLAAMKILSWLMTLHLLVMVVCTWARFEFDAATDILFQTGRNIALEFATETVQNWFYNLKGHRQPSPSTWQAPQPVQDANTTSLPITSYQDTFRSGLDLSINALLPVVVAIARQRFQVR